jgi:uncharacterized protein (DUF433 family)/DNA-binding transcriptional MerR regulator
MSTVVAPPRAAGRSAAPLDAGFYSPADAARLARITRARLDAWRRERVVIPSASLVMDGQTLSGYTFADVVLLRVLGELRERGVTLARAAEAVARHLVERFGPPGPGWKDARIYLTTIERRPAVVVENRDEWERTVATMGGQKMATLLFGEELDEMENRLDAILIPGHFRPYVSIDPSAKSGLPLVAGTAVTTAALYAMKTAGSRLDEIEAAYPSLSPRQIRAAVRFERMLDAA